MLLLCCASCHQHKHYKQLAAGHCFLKNSATVFHASGPSPASKAVLATQTRFHLHKRGIKRQHEEEEDGETGSKAQGSVQLDEDDVMQVAENAYHLDLVKLLREPAVYKQLGLSGPPHTIAHSSLQQKLDSMRFVC